MASQGPPPGTGRKSTLDSNARNSLGPRGRNNTLTLPGPGGGGVQDEMRSLFFVLAMRDEMDNEPFIRLTAENIKNADLITELINGTKGSKSMYLPQRNQGAISLKFRSSFSSTKTPGGIRSSVVAR